MFSVQMFTRPDECIFFLIKQRLFLVFALFAFLFVCWLPSSYLASLVDCYDCWCVTTTGGLYYKVGFVLIDVISGLILDFSYYDAVSPLTFIFIILFADKFALCL